ncbi:MAG TPA: hypothetical protein VF209_00600 [Patescibacteria group bacterium]
MKKLLSSATRLFFHYLPLMVVVSVALFIAYQNILPGTHYSGWDNINGEFDLPRYARQVFFGAWLEHTSFGSPMNLGHLSEIPRLPILFFLDAVLPPHLIRYVFIFSMYTLGGIGMYSYLNTVWLNNSLKFKNWLAGLGALFYLLHILTLQQFYIAFELFTIQFAYLPFLLLAIHYLVKNITARSILLFIVLQLLIAPSGHTPTLFYLGALFSVGYSFFASLNKSVFTALKISLLVAGITFISNAYWILPNAYYTLHNAHYVQESHDNKLFGPESVWSIREAGTIANFLKGTQYLFTWKDYSFENKQFEFIFNDWEAHLSSSLVQGVLYALGLMTVAGLFTSMADGQKSSIKWAIILLYLFCTAFIWIDLLPTSFVFNWLYHNGSFLEAFRNPFTKLSILYSLASVLLMINVVETLLLQLKKSVSSWVHHSISLSFILILGSGLIYSAWPSFQGHLLSERLRVDFPEQYQEMFSYLSSRDRNLRTLQLPQLSHAGWEYYDWQFLGEGNGYQGMGFYFFGMPQALVNRDSDRWAESSDFFYHELKYALDSKDSDHFQQLLDKYRIDLIIIDETKITPHFEHDYELDYEIVQQAGLKQVWQKDFLTIYERESANKEAEAFAPPSAIKTTVTADRVKVDIAQQDGGDYVVSEPTNAQIIYPFSSLLSRELSGVAFKNNAVEVTRKVPKGTYQLTLPGHNDHTYTTPAEIKYEDQTVTITFPSVVLKTKNQSIELPKITDITFGTPEREEALILFFNSTAIFIKQGETIYPVLTTPQEQNIDLKYTVRPPKLPFTAYGAIDGSKLDFETITTLPVDWNQLKKDIVLTLVGEELLTVIAEFPIISANLEKNPSDNCAEPQRGSIVTNVNDTIIEYSADRYGVNCNGYDFDYLSSAASYILNVQGSNLQGRGIKFFVNYSDPEILPEDYLLQDKNYNVFFSLPQVSYDNRLGFHLNWETRSFGKKSSNQLHHIKIGTFPLTQIAQLRLENNNSVSSLYSEATINSVDVWFDSIYVVNYVCHYPESDCLVVLDQSYDDGWVAFKDSLLPHLKYNNWANAWEISGQGKVIIVYVPELVSLASLLILLIGILILLRKNFKKDAHV